MPDRASQPGLPPDAADRSLPTMASADSGDGDPLRPLD
jgi:hypothetical protein